MEKTNSTSVLWKNRHALLALLVLSGIFLASRHSFLLFHSLSELFSVAVAFAIFMVTWNARFYLDNNYLFIIGVSYFFTGTFDIFHTLSYKGMGIFENDANLPTQLWIIARYIQALSLMIAPFCIGKRIRPYLSLSLYSIVGLLSAVSVFYLKIFPACYIEGVGLTTFKIISEYIICLILVVSAVLLYRKRRLFDSAVHRLIMLSIFATIISEMDFTFYLTVYGVPSLIGHYLKIVAYYFIYKALIEKAVMNPHEVLFRNLKKNEEALRKSEAFAKNVLMSSLNGIYIYDINRRTNSFINSQYTRLTGYKQESFNAIGGTDLFRLFHPDDREKMTAHMEALLHADDNDVLEAEYRFKTLDGRWIWCLSRDAVFDRDSNGSVAHTIGTFIDITDRRQAENERERLLKENFEQRIFLEKLMDVIPAGIAVIGGKDHCFKFANPHYRSIVGLAQRPVVGRSVESVFPGDVASDIIKEVETFNREDGSTSVHEYGAILSGDSEMRYWNMHYVSIQSQSWGPSVIMIAVEVSEQVKGRKQAEEMAARDQAVFTSMNDAVILADTHGKITEMNPAALRLHGFDSFEQVENHLQDLVDVLEIRNMDGRLISFEEWPLSKVLRGESFTNYELSVVRKDNNRGWIGSYNGTAVYDTKGEFISALITIRDISIQKKAELELQRSHEELEARVKERTAELVDANKALQEEIAERQIAEKALRESETLLRAVLDNLPVGVWVLDRYGRITLDNPAGRQIWNGERDGGLTELGRFKGWRPDTGEVIRKEQWAAARAITKGESHINEQVEIECFDGTHKIILNSAIPIRNANGGITAAIIVHQDITEQRRIEEERKIYTERLEWSNRELQDFAFVASHDLQEPLRKIRAFGDLLKKDSAKAIGKAGADYIERMQHAAGRMQILIRDLLTYSRVSTQAEPFSEVDLKKIADEVLLDLEVIIRESGAQVEIGRLGVVEADPNQMRQLFQNLIGNALKFRGDEKPVVSISGKEIFIESTASRKKAYEIIVRDNGIGFDEKYRDRIFGPFQRLHGRMDFEGTGMGLAICRRIIERHGGFITAKSTPGKGSRFIVSLPMRQKVQERHLGLT